jgi:hypothetical protein
MRYGCVWLCSLAQCSAMARLSLRLSLGLSLPESRHNHMPIQEGYFALRLVRQGRETL